MRFVGPLINAAGWRVLFYPMGREGCKILLCLKEVTAMQYGYLWFPYIFWENLNLFAGDGGTGKSYLALAVAAAITRGRQPAGMPGTLMQGEIGRAHV